MHWFDGVLVGLFWLGITKVKYGGWWLGLYLLNLGDFIDEFLAQNNWRLRFHLPFLELNVRHVLLHLLEMWHADLPDVFDLLHLLDLDGAVLPECNGLVDGHLPCLNRHLRDFVRWDIPHGDSRLSPRVHFGLVIL